MSQLAVSFTAKEALQQLERDILRLGVDTTNISLEQWKKYIIARTVEEVLLIDLFPKFHPEMESAAAYLRSHYRRVDGEDTFTLHQDVGSNKLFPHIGSADLPFESELELYRHCILICPRKVNSQM